jgi:hypothetical protein
MESNIDFDKVKETAIDISFTFTKAACSNIIHLINTRQNELDGMFQLALFSIDRIEALHLLVKADKLWDAEILFRTVLEVFMKFLYIIRQKTPEATKDKLDEYWVHLNEIEKLSLSYEATKLINTKSMGDPERFQHMVLTAEQKAVLEARYPKDDRKKLNNDWSFNGMYISMLKDKEAKNLLSLDTIHYFWKMSSHIAHGHKFGINAAILRSTLKELKLYNNATQVIKLIKASTMVCIWILVEMAERLKDDEAYNMASAMSKEYNAYMRANYKELDEESNKAEDDFIKNQSK